MNLKRSWESQLKKMIAQAEQQKWWAISANLYCALAEIRKLTMVNKELRKLREAIEEKRG